MEFAGYALSSVEGRVAMEFFDLSESGQSKKYVNLLSIFVHIVVPFKRLLFCFLGFSCLFPTLAICIFLLTLWTLKNRIKENKHNRCRN